MNEISAHFNLPFLFASQAQKEIIHNEAIQAIDCLLHPVVEAKLDVPPSVLTDNDIGKSWRIGSSPSGVWQGRADEIAYWIGGGWRYFAAQTGMQVFDRQLDVLVVYAGNAWLEPASIVNPTQGTIIDLEARTAISAILDAMRASFMIPA